MGYESIVELLLQIDDSSPFISDSQFVLFQLAAENGRTNTLRLLSNKYQFPNHVYYNCVTRSVDKGYAGTLQFLIEQPRCTHLNWAYIMTDACKNGHFEMVKMLLSDPDDKFNPISRNYDCLTKAINKGSVEVVKLLLDYSRSKGHYLSNRIDYMTIACHQGNHRMVKLLLEEGRISPCEYDMYYSAKRGHLKIVRLLSDISDLQNGLIGARSRLREIADGSDDEVISDEKVISDGIDKEKDSRMYIDQNLLNRRIIDRQTKVIDFLLWKLIGQVWKEFWLVSRSKDVSIDVPEDIVRNIQFFLIHIY